MDATIRSTQTAPTRRALQTPDGALTQATLDRLDIRADMVFDAQPMSADGAHAIFKGVNAQGQKVVVKDNSEVLGHKTGWMATLYRKGASLLTNDILPGSGRLQNMNDILLRQVFKNHIDCPVIAAREAVFVDPRTQQLHFGVESPWVENMDSINDPKAPPLANPMQAARGVVYSSLLMGNWDSTWHEDNNNEISGPGRMSDGTPETAGEYIQADLGWGGQRGNSVAGRIPFGSLELLHSLPAQDVKAAVDEVLALKDDQIRSWIDEAGRQCITGWNEKLCNFYTDALCHNRDELAKHLAKDPQWLTNPPDEADRGAGEKAAQRHYMPVIVLQKYANMAFSGVLHHVTTHDQMAQQIRDALRSQQAPYPSSTSAG